MAKRKRPKGPGVGSLIPSSHDSADLPKGMNSKSGDNGPLSRWGRWKTKLANLCSSLRAHIALIGCIIASFSLLIAIVFNFERSRQYAESIVEIRHQFKEIINKIDKHYQENIDQNKENISFLTNIIQEQNKVLEKLRIRGNLTSDIMTSIEPPRIGASVSRGSIEVTLSDIAPKQFIVTGKLDRVPKGKGWWIGTRSGLRFWPQIELPPDIQEGQSFKYRVTIPPNIASGEVVLMEAGSEANQLFKRQMAGKYYEVGLFWPHLKDAQVIASVDFQ